MSGFIAGKPKQLFEGHYVMSNYASASYAVSPDSQRFLVIKPVVEQEQSPPTQINIVQNWTEELKRLVPTGK